MTPADTYIFDRIAVNSGRCDGRPTSRGERLTVQTAREILAAGDSLMRCKVVATCP